MVCNRVFEMYCMVLAVVAGSFISAVEEDTVQQGRQVREYINDAVNDPYAVGAHWFQ